MSPPSTPKPALPFWRWLCVGLLLTLIPLQGCGQPGTQLGLKIQSMLSASQLQRIRSFRVMAFNQSIYKCDPRTNRITFTRVGYDSTTSFDWQQATGETPKVRLFLPKDAVGKTWALQVEAYEVTRASQATTPPFAQGCTSDLQIFDERPLSAQITLTLAQ